MPRCRTGPREIRIERILSQQPATQGHSTDNERHPALPLLRAAPQSRRVCAVCCRRFTLSSTQLCSLAKTTGRRTYNKHNNCKLIISTLKDSGKLDGNYKITFAAIVTIIFVKYFMGKLLCVHFTKFAQTFNRK
jgi:hypothetical protein